MISSAHSFLLSQASIESCSVINFQDCKYTPFNIYKVWSISFAKKFEVLLEEVSALKFFLSSLYSYWIIFQISSSQSDLCSNCNERSPEVYQLRSSQQEKLWFQTWSNKVCFRPFKNKEKIGQVFNVWRTFEEFSGLDLQTRYIINVIPLGLMSETFGQMSKFLSFFTFLQSTGTSQTDWQTYFLNPC